MTTATCPICGADAGEMEPRTRTGEFDVFDCPTHDEFEVSDTAMSIRLGKASQSEWERALERAKLRAESGKRPRILEQDFL
jgi:hypothetical protein